MSALVSSSPTAAAAADDETSTARFVKGKRIECVARVLRRHRYSDYLCWFDVAVASSTHKDCLSLYSVMVKSVDRAISSPTADFRPEDIHAGDVVKIFGFLEEPVIVADSRREDAAAAAAAKDGHWNVGSIVVLEGDGSKITQLLPWDSTAQMNFVFDEKMYITSETPRIASIQCDNRLPNLVLQVHGKSIQKTIALLREMYPRALFRESTTFLAKNKEHLICAFDYCNCKEKEGVSFTSPSSAAASGAAAVSAAEPLSLAALATDELLSHAVKRVYPVCYKRYPFCVSAHLDDAIEQFKSTIYAETNSGRDGVRIHANPGYAADYMVKSTTTTSGRASTNTSSSTSSRTQREREEEEEEEEEEEASTVFINWNPKKFTKTLSIVYVDGLWVLSLVDASEHPTHCIYEVSNHFGIQNHSKADADRVCKSINKLHEILVRTNWIYDTARGTAESERRRHSYGLCIDVGAAPGGWTSYLAKNVSCKKILSVDKGDLKLDPIPENVEHWRLLGQQAIKQLFDISTSPSRPSDPDEYTIDLYCCDANIEPVVSTAILVSCATQSLLKKGARFVLTLKNCLAKKQQWNDAKKDSFNLLSQHFTNCIIVDLLSNTPNECTIYGEYV